MNLFEFIPGPDGRSQLRQHHGHSNSVRQTRRTHPRVAAMPDHQMALAFDLSTTVLLAPTTEQRL